MKVILASLDQTQFLCRKITRQSLVLTDGDVSRLCVIFLVTIFFFMGDIDAWAYEKISGDAVVVLQQKKKTRMVRQAIRIDEATARFVSLDDFGNTVLVFSFVKDARGRDRLQIGSDDFGKNIKGSRVRQLLKLDLTQREISDLLLWKVPQGWTADSEKKRMRKNKRLQAYFLETETYRGQLYPHRIKMISGQNSLTIRWQKIDILE